MSADSNDGGTDLPACPECGAVLFAVAFDGENRIARPCGCVLGPRR